MKFSLLCEVTVSAFTVVEADTLEEAIKIAELRDVEVGDERAGVDPEEVWAITDADGQPCNIHGDE